MARGTIRAVMALAVLSALPAWASVVVYQVEADEVSNATENTPDTTGNQYAPVNFGSNNSSAWDSDTTIYGTPNTNTSQSTYSGHAASVASFIYGVNAVAANAVNAVYTENADTFLVNRLTPNYSTGSGAAPTALINDINSKSIRVSNHSYVGSFNSFSDPNATVSTDRDVTRRLDYVIRSTDLVLVAGAASDQSGNTRYSRGSYSPLVWSSYNSISVSGGQDFSPLTGASDRVGKVHADLYYNDLASFGTARVSGYSVGLIQTGQDMQSTNAQKGLVVKSVLMTGATKESGWTRDLNNNLSVFYGAGTANYDRSKAILKAGEKSFATVTGGTQINQNEAGKATTDAAGWAYASTTPAAGASRALILNVGSTISDFTATLNWHVSYGTLGSDINTSDSSEIFAHLSLALCSVTLNPNGSMTIGSAINTTTLSSAVLDDNVQHLYASGLNLAAGYYALVVTNNTTDGDTSDYALSYSYATIPEPASAVLIGLGATGLLMRRRRADN